MGYHHLFFLGATAATTTLDKLKAIPPAFWLKVGIAVLAVILITVVLRKLMSVNSFILGAVVFIAMGGLFLNWLYYRTEPKFLSPVMDRIAPFFPSAGAYEVKQQQSPTDDKTHKK